MTQVVTVSGDGMKRRRLRRWAVRVLLVVILLLAVAYAALPVWLPRSWLAARVVDQLSADLHRPVRIGGVRIGWNAGLVFQDLAIGDQPGSPNPLLARASRLRCRFTPLTTLFTGKVDRLEIDNPQLWLVFDEQGRLTNLADLGPRPHRRLPSLSYLIRQAACHVLTPHAAQTFTIDQLQCDLEPETGLLSLLGEATISRPSRPTRPAGSGRLTLAANVTVPRLKPDETLHGNVHVGWADLALTDLPQPLVARLPVEQVDGTTTGQLTFAAHPDLGIDYDLFLAFNGVRILRRGFDRPAQVPDAELHCQGHWDPTTDTVLMREFDYETQAIRVGRSGEPDTAAVLIDPKGETAFALHLAGQIKDWRALGREFPEVDAFARAAGATLTGSAELTVAFAQRRDEDHLTLTVDGQQSRWVVATGPVDYLSADVGVPKTLHAEFVRNRRTRQLSQPHLRLTVGDLSLAASSQITVPAPEAAGNEKLRWWADALPTLRCDLTIETHHLEQVVPLLPFLPRLTDVTGWRGPLALKTSVTPAEGFSQLHVAARTSPETSLAFRDRFAKPPGQTLSLAADLRVPHRATGRVDDLSLEMTHGPSHVRTDPEPAQLTYAFAFLHNGSFGVVNNEGEPADRPIAVDAAWEIPLRIERIEGLRPLFPQWQQWHRARPETGISGSVDLAVRGGISYRPGDWLLRGELDVVADDLAIRWDGQVDKPAGAELTATLAHRFHLVGSQREQSLTARLRQPAGELTGFITFAGVNPDDGPGPMGQDFEHATIQADVSDLEAFLAVTPALTILLAPFQPSGAIALHIDSLLIADQHTVSLSADATGAGFVIPGAEPVTKPPATPAELAFQWRSDRAGRKQNEQRWELTRGFVHLAGARVTGLSGRVVTGWEPATTNPPRFARQVVDRHAPAPILTSATLHAQAELVFDDALARLHPRLARWQRAFKLSGSTSGKIQARLEPDTLALKGRIDAGPMNASLEWDSRIAAGLRKPIGVPASLAFDLVASRRPDTGGYQIDCRDLTLDLDGNRVATTGTLTLSPPARPPLALGDLALATHVQLPRPDRAAALLTDSRIDRAEGAATASIEVRRSEDQLRLGPAELEFDQLAIGFAGHPILLDGQVSVDETHAQVGQLRWAWGRSGGVISGRVRRRADGRIDTGRIGLALDHLDVPDLRRCLASLPGPRGSPAGAAERAAATLAAVLIDQLRHADLNLDAHIASLELSLPLEVDVLADAVASHTTVQDGGVQLAFRALVDAGLVTGELTSNLAVDDPTFHLTYTADHIQPGATVDRYLTRTFPGMKADGPLTLIDESYQKLLPEPGDPNFEVGKGELIIEGGTVAGRAAPLWMTSLFPGLNLARFDFSYMHSWFEKFPSGRIRHQMIFQGRFYNIYMVGRGDADGYMKYEVGIDFLADFDSRYWAEVGQGRIPLFTKTGRILDDGTVADERVDYVPRRFIESLLVGNNPLVTAYHAVRKRVLGRD